MYYHIILCLYFCCYLD